MPCVGPGVGKLITGEVINISTPGPIGPLPAARVAEVQIEARSVRAADVSIITDEFVRAPEPRTSI